MCRLLSVVGILGVCKGVAAFFCCAGDSVETGAPAGREVGSGAVLSRVTGFGDIARFAGRDSGCFGC